ncbi:hypothetical protein BJ322DRAFT_871177 [Thelephora terrestris]|uniref:Uncharacterized protein n=1 Tax=Thelephora terrestris TaxID=56493 RepID=A0A9P6HGE6_9AGAM|nr:hypothetical protein BJ322DRAFT_871177 [Thelephora terrestris]
MVRRNRRARDREDDEDDPVTPEEIEEIELEAWRPLLQLAADKNLNTIIAWLKCKYPVGACAVHPNDHCFNNKLGHWILDLYKLIVWAVEIKRRKTTGTRPPILDPAFLDDMAEVPEVSRHPPGTAVSTASVTALPPTSPVHVTYHHPQSLAMQFHEAPCQYVQHPAPGCYPGGCPQAPAFLPSYSFITPAGFHPMHYTYYR